MLECAVNLKKMEILKVKIRNEENNVNLKKYLPNKKKEEAALGEMPAAEASPGETRQTALTVGETPVFRTAPLSRCKPSLSKGLTAEQIQNRIENGAVNTPVDAESLTFKDIVRENVCTYFNLIFLIIAILLCVVGSFRDLTFLPIILANIFIGIFQEWRSKKTLDKLTILSAPKIRTLREGKEQVIPAEELVLDDLVIFEAGNQIPADAVVEEGEVSVNEALITGEADEISKKPGDNLLSGSFIVSGQCKARLDKVGADSYVSKLTLEAKAQQRGEQSEMIRSLDRLVKIVGILIIPIGILLFSQQFFINGESFRGSVTGTVAAVTVTVQVADLPSAVAVMVALPAPTAVTLPVLSTVATASSLLLQFTVLLVASAGCTVAVRGAVSPVNRESEVGARVTPVTRTGAGLIVSVNSLLSLPLLLVAVTVNL